MNPRNPLIATAAALGALAFAGSASAATSTFANTTPIQPDDGQQNGPPGLDPSNYPATLDVSGLAGSITHVKLTLDGVNSASPADLDVALVSPDATPVIVMSDVGGGDDISGRTISIDDAAVTPLPATGPIASGTYRPTNLEGSEEFPGADDGSALQLSAFNGREPNGQWQLLVMDDHEQNLSAIGGWKLTITTTAGKIVSRGGAISTPDPAIANGPPAPATTYPSDLAVSGVAGTIDHMTVTLDSFAAPFAQDADMLLVGPNGRKVALMSDTFRQSISGRLTFDDRARLVLPVSQEKFADVYRPVNYPSGQANELGGDTFPAPAPARPFDPTLDGAFHGISPNGKWSLYVTDDQSNGGAVQISGGWSINFTLKPAPKPAPAPQPQPQPRSVAALTRLSLKAKRFRAKKGTTVRYSLTTGAKVRFRVQRRLGHSRRFRPLRGTIVKAGVAGANRFRFRGKIGGRRLKPGSYRLKASVAGGNSRKVRFRIVKPAS